MNRSLQFPLQWAWPPLPNLLFTQWYLFVYLFFLNIRQSLFNIDIGAHTKNSDKNNKKKRLQSQKRLVKLGLTCLFALHSGL